MEPPELLHGILEELNITSLDDSDLDLAGLTDGPSEEGSLVSAGGTLTALGGPFGYGRTSDGASVGETSADSAFSADVRAALESPQGPLDSGIGGDACGETSASLEARLRLRLAPTTIGGVSGGNASLAASGGPLAWQAAAAAAVAAAPGDAAQRQSFQQSFQQSLQQSQTEKPRAPDPSAAAPAASLTPGPSATTAPTQTAPLAAAPATGAFRLQMSDLTVSEALYHALRKKPDDELNIREWVQLRFHEARETHKAEIERLRLEVEALRENLFAAQTRAERFERQFQRRDAAATDLAQELERQQQEARAQRDQLTHDLRRAERHIAEIKEKEQRYDSVSKEVDRLREELTGLLGAMAAESAGQQRLAKDHADTMEKFANLENEHRLVRKDAEAHERRATVLEETVARRDDEVAELRNKVDTLREKKRELARKAAAEQVSTSNEIRERVDAEIARLRDRSEADLDAVRTNLVALHAKEVQMLQERLASSESRNAELQRRFEDEEHAHQQLQLSLGRVRAEMQNEITELSGALKLRAFEAERAFLTQEEVSLARQQLEVQNEKLRSQVDVLRKEYYTLEVQYREGRAAERAELASLREQLRGYSEVEKELDAAIRACATGPLGDATVQPQTTEEALLLGTTLASAPTSAQRRIQQSLLLAQELQRKTRELTQARIALRDAETEVSRLKEELDVARKEAQYSSEPQAYLLEALRHREREVLELRRQARATDAELERCRQQAEQHVKSKLQVEEDLKKVLAQRQHLNNLRAVLGGGGAAGGESDAGVLLPAEHRGRAPSQQPAQALPRPITAGYAAGTSGGGCGASSGTKGGDGHGTSHQMETQGAGDVSDSQGSGHPAWFARLRTRLDTSQK
eukprot:TRINITY_DN73630_c0_g1_i1.p1 TRINITY_DN73630_c0_g1~~TRINITY_DN73630_c0_g1_i1.p1  ORF type:complete len:870 (-),score=214.16 TRINITY_DN73630_c0_g1_i1:55-2664(-)